MQNKKNNKKRNPVAKELYTPKYKSKVIPNKKKFSYIYDDKKNLLDEDIDEGLFGYTDEQTIAEYKKKGK